MRSRPIQGAGKAPQCRAPPCPAHAGRSQPGKHGHMQTRNAHEMSHACGPEHIPVAAVNGGLIPHHQSRQNPGAFGGIGIGAWPGQLGQQALAHHLSPTLDRVQPGAGQTNRWRVFSAGAHIACGAYALLPQPQLVIKAARVHVAMRRFQAHTQTPAFSGLHRLGQSRTAPPAVVGSVLAVPTQIHLRWQITGHIHLLEDS